MHFSIDEDEEMDYTIGSLHGSNTVIAAGIDSDSNSESQILHKHSLPSRDILMMNDNIEAKVPRYVNANPMFTQKYFQFVDCTANHVTAICTSCGERKLGLSTTISNFTTHLKRRHPEVYAQLEKFKSTSYVKAKRPTKTNVLKENVENAIIRFIIQDMQPFMRTETSAFRNLIAVCLGYTDNDEAKLPFNLMGEKTVKRRISKLYDEHVKNLEKTLSKQRWFCLTMDIWSCKNRSFLGVSIHYIDEQTFERNSFVLTCQDFPSPHTHERIAERLQILYHKFSLKPSSIVASVTDNGSNFVCTFKVFGRNMTNLFEELKQSCNSNDNGHEYQSSEVDKITESLLQLSDETGEFSESDLENEACDLYDILYSSDEENEDSVTDQNNSRDELDFNYACDVIKNAKLNEDDLLMLPNRIPCNTHNLNLIGGVDSWAACKNKAYAKIYTSVFEKLNLLWDASGNQKSSEIIIKCLGRNFNKPNKTRWNWLYDRLSEALRFDTIKLNLTMMSLQIKPFTKNETQFLLEYKLVLKPIARALDNLQQSKAPYAIVLPTLYETNNELNRLQTGNSLKFCKPLLTAIVNGFNKRLGHLLDVDDERSHAALIATVTHPFFKMRWIATEKRTTQYFERILNILADAANEIFIEDDIQNSRPISRNSAASNETSGGAKGKLIQFN